MSLFQSSVLKKHLAAQDQDSIASAFEKYKSYFLDRTIQENIRNSKEEQFQEGFLRELFVNILGYTINPNPEFNLTTELKNIKDAKKTDGAVLKDGKALAVIELKGTDTKDLDKVTDQAFNYKNNQPECVYVVTSNFEKLRFYVHNAVEHVEFNLFTLTLDQFKLLWLFLQKNNLLNGIPQKVKEESLVEEEKVTKRLYKDYSAFKSDLWQDMCRNNSEADELELYKKSQKLLDRFLFIFFAEDKGLLPPNSISVIVEQWKKLKELDEYKPLYSRFQKYFGYMNDGFKGKNYEIHAYNGGLFKADPLLDDLTISDDVLEMHVLKLTEYDFETEVDTNILGHIFEHSLNDIENVRAQLAGEELDKSKTKRKKDGVFYTPKYITKYIVDNTVGKLCEEKKAEIGIDEEEYAKDRKGRRSDTLKRLDEQLKQYRDWLLQLTICDPACGSGAFLNQTLEFLMAEHRYVDELESQLLGYAMVFQDVENHILERNLFGVDINEESVEIARLSLWLRTAQKGRKLTSLSSNIKVGNSLIDDPEVAGELAFNWQNQFPTVFENGGFDVVIGNPPYVGLEEISDIDKQFYKSKFSVLSRKYDLSVAFKLQAISLVKEKGLVSYVSTVTWQTGENYSAFREAIFATTDLICIVNLPFDVFVDAYVDTGIFILRKTKFTGQYSIFSYPKKHTITDISHVPFSIVDESIIDRNNWKIILNPQAQQIFVAASNSPNAFPLGDITISTQGLSASRFDIREDSNDTYEYPFLIAGQAYHYHLSVEAISYTTLEDNSTLKPYYDAGEKILIRRLISRQDRLVIAYTEKKMVFKKDVNPFIVSTTKVSTKFLMGVLSSKLISFLYLNTSSVATKDDFRQTTLGELRSLPVIIAENQSPIENNVEKRLSVSKELYQLTENQTAFFMSKFLIDKPSKSLQSWPQLDFKGFLAELKKKKIELGLEEEAEWLTYFNKKKTAANALQAEIDRIDKQIDLMVYELYGLNEEEVRVVEEAS